MINESKSAMPINTLSRFTVGDQSLRYLIDSESQRVGLEIIPRSMGDRVVVRRELLDEPALASLPAQWLPLRAWNVDSLVQVGLVGVPGPGRFAQGRTLRNGAATESLKFSSQRKDGNRIVTVLKSDLGFECEHSLAWARGGEVLECKTRFINSSRRPLTLAMLSSFSLGSLSPFHADDAPGKLCLHRFRSAWTAEGRHESRRLEDLQIERSWIGGSATCERFGQVGSLPVRGFFPVATIEDTEAGVAWAAQIAWAGSWQMEVYRRDDCANFSGGLADREFGHWTKTVAPGKAFETPPAFLTVVRGGIDKATTRLQAAHRTDVPDVERDLPVLFNEWCTSWGSPTHDNLVAIADRLRGTGVRYLVIDAGWAKGSAESFLKIGDWNVNRKSFPGGLRATADAIRARGLIPGIWFEFEVVTENAKAFAEARHQLHCDGVPIHLGDRRFWDFRDPWVHRYLTKKVIGLIRDNGIGYLKVDYNDTIGIGCDGSQSLGEGLRAHIAGVRDFFQKIRRELPGLVIEICASGGHRLEPSLLDFGAMGSFSDAHETLEVPIIAANVGRLIPARKNQIWAALRKTDSPQRIAYSLAATFLGRMCLSGDVHHLDKTQWALALRAVKLYRRIAPILRDGVSRRVGPEHVSYRHPTGWQAVTRLAGSGKQAVVVVHSFAEPFPKSVGINLPECGGRPWVIADSFHANRKPPEIRGNRLAWSPEGAFRACVIWLKQK
jgi:alpha-galactosidase